MVFKFSMNIYGDTFIASSIIDKIIGNIEVHNYWDPTDKRSDKENEIYGFGNIDIKPKIKYATGVSQIRYAKQFVKILEDNYVLIKNAGGDEVEIYIEAYYDGKQCNFQIFDNKILAEFAKYEVSLPISVYRLGVRKISAWEEEIEKDWLLNGDLE